MSDAHDSPSAALSRRDLLRAGAAALASSIVLPPGLRVESDAATRVPRSRHSDLDVALRAERWIRATRIETPNGATWPADPLKPASVEYDLYNGMPGIVLFYLELHHATRDAKWLDV